MTPLSLHKYWAYLSNQLIQKLFVFGISPRKVAVTAIRLYHPDRKTTFGRLCKVFAIRSQKS